MPNPLIPGLYSTTIEGTFFNIERWANVWHWRTDNQQQASEATITIQHTRILGFYNDIDTHRSPDHVVKSATTRYLGAVGVAPQITQENNPGGGAGEALPPQVALVIGLYTNLATRRGRGRLYLNGFTANSLQNGRPNATLRNAVLNAMDTRLEAMWADPAGIAPVVATMVLGGAANGITSIRCGDRWDTQRRRAQQFTETFDVRAITQ